MSAGALTPPQERLVRYLHAAGHASTKLVARALYRGPAAAASATRLLESMQAAGLVEVRHTRSPRCGVPVYSWQLTPAGVEAAEALPSRDEVLGALRAELGDGS